MCTLFANQICINNNEGSARFVLGNACPAVTYGGCERNAIEGVMKTEMIRASTPDARLISDAAPTLIFSDSPRFVHRAAQRLVRLQYTHSHISYHMNVENCSLSVIPDDSNGILGKCSAYSNSE